MTTGEKDKVELAFDYLNSDSPREKNKKMVHRYQQRKINVRSTKN